MSEAIYSKKICVRAVDIDQSGLIQPVIFTDYLLESASEQAGRFSLGVPDLFRVGKTWVLSRLHLEFVRFPAWGESLEIKTWPSARLPLFAMRDFEVSNEHGVAVRATSSWLIIDLETRRPARTADHMEGFPLLDRRAIEDDFTSLPALSREDARREFPVFYSDLDINRHFTATAYIHRALETAPQEILFAYRPARIEVNFRSEAFYGDSILSRLERVSTNDRDARPTFLHRLSRSSDDKELTLLRTVWSRIPMS